MSDSPDLTTDKEIEVLEHLSQSEGRAQALPQRDLARVIGMSLGMTNAILKRLSHKGYLTIRKVNNRNIAYAVTPAGLDAVARRSYRYLRRTIKNIVLYKEAIESFVQELKGDGYRSVRLVGESDLSFIVEHAAVKHGLQFLVGRNNATDTVDGKASALTGLREDDFCFTLYSETIEPKELPEETSGDGDAYLGRILAERTR